MKRFSLLTIAFFSFFMVNILPQAHAEKLKPFILGNTVAGDMAAVTRSVQASISEQGFTIVGSYSPFPGATVICATHNDLLEAVANADNGAFGAAQRIAVTEINNKLQVTYMNPVYLGTAYGLGNLEGIAAKLEKSLGNTMEFGAKGVKEEKLGPGKYHYKMLMPYFQDVDVLNTFPDYQTAVARIEENLAAGKGGTGKVYRIDLPGKEISVFGIAITQGDGPDSGAKDTDKEILDIIDFKEYRSTAYLPYEILVQGPQAIALRGRYRIAVHFPDTTMVGEHGFTAIMSAPGGIKKALKAVAGK